MTLLLAFGAFVAAVLPVALALTAFFAATALVFITSNVFPIDHSTFSVMLLIGLAVGIDYSLFCIRREREEGAAGRSADAALQAAGATSGRSVLISGLTVSGIQLVMPLVAVNPRMCSPQRHWKTATRKPSVQAICPQPYRSAELRRVVRFVD